MTTFLQRHLLNNKNHILKGENHSNLHSRSSGTIYSNRGEAEGLKFESAEMESIEAEAMYN
jgi:hypothetical protein